MSMRIITGCTGTTHVTSNNDGEFNQAIFGDGLVVLSNGNKLSASVVNNNKITVKDGDLVLQGRHALIEPNTTQDVTIETGTVDMNRNDLIVAQYTLDASTGYEDIKLVVKKGTETSGTASDPSYTTGVIRTGAALVEAPLYRVKIEGISITALECLFTPIENIIDGSSADKISYDNTESGMEATNVQDAIDECNENLSKQANYATSEVAIGTWNGKTLYRKLCIGTLSSANAYSVIDASLTRDTCEVVNSHGSVRIANGNIYNVNFYISSSYYSGLSVQQTGVVLDYSASLKGASYSICLEYVKN